MTDTASTATDDEDTGGSLLDHLDVELVDGPDGPEMRLADGTVITYPKDSDQP